MEKIITIIVSVLIILATAHWVLDIIKDILNHFRELSPHDKKRLLSLFVGIAIFFIGSLLTNFCTTQTEQELIGSIVVPIFLLFIAFAMCK